MDIQGYVNGILENALYVFVLCILCSFAQVLFGRKIRPSLFSNLSVVLCVRFLVPFQIHLLSVHIPMKSDHAFAAIPAAQPVQSTPEVPMLFSLAEECPVFSPENLVLAVYLTVAAAILVWRFISYWRFQYDLLNHSHPVQDSLWIDEIHKMACDAGLKKKFRILETDMTSSPAVVGVICPVLLIPSQTAGQRYIDHLRPAIGHEICHIRRHDVLRKLLFSVVEIVYWFLPPVWIWSRLSKETIELACDETVTAPMSTDEKFRYLECMMEVAHTSFHRNKIGGTLLFAHSKGYNKIKKRIDFIVNSSYQKKHQALVLILFLAGMAVPMIGVSASYANSITVSLAYENHDASIEEIAEQLNEQAYAIFTFYELSFLGPPSSVPGYLVVEPQLCTINQQNVLASIRTTKDLKELIWNTFEPQVADWLMEELLDTEHPLYIDADEKLCMSAQVGRTYSVNQLLGWDFESLSVLESTSNEIYLQAHTRRPNQNMTFDSILKLVKENGKWVLTQTYFTGSL